MSRKAVEVSAVVTDESFEAFQYAGILEDFGVEFESAVGVVAAGAATVALLTGSIPRSAVGAKEEARQSRDAGRIGRFLVSDAFVHRLVEEVGPELVAEEVVHIGRRVVRRDSCCRPRIDGAFLRSLYGRTGSDVLEDDAEAWKLLAEREEFFLEEHLFAVDGVNFFATIVDELLAVEIHDEILLLALLEDRIRVTEVKWRLVGTGGRAARIVLEAEDDPALLRFPDVSPSGARRVVEGHQWLEGRTWRARREDTLAIRLCFRDRDDGSGIWHDDRSAELASRRPDVVLEVDAVAEMEMPVVAESHLQTHGEVFRVAFDNHLLRPVFEVSIFGYGSVAKSEVVWHYRYFSLGKEEGIVKGRKPQKRVLAMVPFQKRVSKKNI